MINEVLKKLKFSDKEISQDGKNVKWSRFKYVMVKGVENSDGTPKKRLSSVSERTPPGELTDCFNGLIQEYPFHQLMAIWQRVQSDSIKDSLPLHHVLCVHDFSENYQFAFQDEVFL